MTIHEDFTELEQITIELKRLRMRVRELNNLKHQCEERILVYMQQYDHPGLRFGDTIITTKQYKSTKRQTRERQIQRGTNILSEYGIDNARDVMESLLGNLKGSPVQKQVLKVSTIKK